MHLEGELAVGEEKVGLIGPPRAQHALPLLNHNVHGVGILLHEAKEVDVLADGLIGCGWDDSQNGWLDIEGGGGS